MGREAKSTPVYATGQGTLCRACGRPEARCCCRAAKAAVPGDGVVRVGRETKGRRGKGVTVVTGVPLAGEALERLAGELKRACGSGGTVRDGAIEIQGEHRDRLVDELTRRGLRVKRAGG
jgi:translation initiation factor 1